MAILALAVPDLAGAAGMRSAFRWEASDVHVERRDVDSVYCRVCINVIDDAVARGRAVVLQPYVLVDGVKLRITPASFYRLDGRGRRTKVRSGGLTASGAAHEVEKVCGLSKGVLELSGTIAGLDAGAPAEVRVDVYEVRATDRVTLAESRLAARLSPRPRPEFVPEYILRYVEDKDRYRFERHLTVPLLVDFEDGKNVFNADLGVNQGALFEFTKAVGPVVSSANTRVHEISLTAYCGITGSVASNNARMQARLNAVYAYLKKTGAFGRKAVGLKVVGEDWASLQAWFLTTSWHHDRRLDDIIFGPASKDTKERNLRECVTFWRYMEDNLFPQLERYECAIRFSMADYADDAERWKAYNADKRLLSQYDYCCLMKSVTEFSQSWYDLAFDFADVYPLCREAQVDALAAVLSLGRLNQATDYLRYLSGQEATFYRCTWLMLQDRVEEAYELALTLEGQSEVYDELYAKISAINRWSSSPTPWDVEMAGRPD